MDLQAIIPTTVLKEIRSDDAILAVKAGEIYKNKILANTLIFLTDIPEEWRIRRFVESSLEASKNLKIRKCERSEHFRYIKL